METKLSHKILWLSLWLILKFVFLRQIPASPWMHVGGIGIFGTGSLLAVFQFIRFRTGRKSSIIPDQRVKNGEKSSLGISKWEFVIAIAISSLLLRWPIQFDDLPYILSNVLVMVIYSSLYEILLSVLAHFALKESSTGN